MSEQFTDIQIDEVVRILQCENTRYPERNAREWLYKMGIKGFKKGYYPKEIILERKKQEVLKRCCQLEKEANTFMLGGLLAGAKSQPMSKKVQSLIQEKRRLNMCTT